MGKLWQTIEFIKKKVLGGIVLWRSKKNYIPKNFRTEILSQPTTKETHSWEDFVFEIMSEENKRSLKLVTKAIAFKTIKS